MGMCALLFFCAVLYVNSGAFWRDELSSVMLAQQPSLADMYAYLETDSAPLLFAVLLKLWIGLGPGHSDGGLALAGFLVFAGMLLAFFWTTRTFGIRQPLLGFSLFFFSPLMFFWCTSLRSYGLAALLCMAFSGTVWRMVARGGREDFLLAILTAVLCAQANYQASYLILSICLAGSVVCGLRRQPWRAVLILFAGFCAALSLLPYLPVMRRASAWLPLFQSSFDPMRPVVGMLRAVGAGSLWLGGCWVVVLVILAVLARRLPPTAETRGAAPPPPTTAPLLPLYGLLVILFSLATLWLFSWKVGHPMNPWYYIPAVAVVACHCDIFMQPLLMRCRGRWFMIGTAAGFMLYQLPALYSHSITRRTNMDAVASLITRSATPNDLIVVSPCWLGHAFKYYYRGEVPWLALPYLTGTDIEKPASGALLLMSRQGAKACRPACNAIDNTLRNGGRVWVVGGVAKSAQGIPEPPPGSDIDSLTCYWATVVGTHLSQHAVSVLPVLLPATTDVLALEALPVHVFETWAP